MRWVCSRNCHRPLVRRMLTTLASQEGLRMSTQTKKARTTVRRARATATKRSKATKAKVQGFMNSKRVRQVQRKASEMVEVAGAMITTAKKRMKRAAARQRLKTKVRKAGAALKEVGKAAGFAALAAGAS